MTDRSGQDAQQMISVETNLSNILFSKEKHICKFGLSYSVFKLYYDTA